MEDLGHPCGLPLGYQLTKMDVRQYVNALEGYLASSKKMLKSMKIHPDKHVERALTDMEEKVYILSDEGMELSRYLWLMEEEGFMSQVANCENPKESCWRCQLLGSIPTPYLLPLHHCGILQDAEKATEARKILREPVRISRDLLRLRRPGLSGTSFGSS